MQRDVPRGLQTPEFCIIHLTMLHTSCKMREKMKDCRPQ